MPPSLLQGQGDGLFEGAVKGGCDEDGRSAVVTDLQRQAGVWVQGGPSGISSDTQEH